MTRIRIIICAALMFGIQTDGMAYQATAESEDYGLAVGYYERQEYESAVAKFREVIANNPSTRKAAVSYFYLGESLIQLHDYAAAFPTYKIFLSRLPQDKLSVRAQFRLAECAFRLNWEKQAIELLEDFVGKHPDDTLNEYALTYLGEVRLQRNEPQIALQVFDRAISEYPNSRNLLRNRFGIARALQAMHRFEEAQKFYDLITSDPANPFAGQAKLQIGIIEFERSNFDAAKEALLLANEWMRSGELLPEAKYWLAKTDMALGNFDLAYRCYDEVVEQVIDQEMKVAVFFDGALAASKIGENEAALSWLNRLTKTWPDSPWADDALQLKIEILFQEKQFDRCKSVIERFTSDYANHKNLPLITEYRGRIAYERQNHRETVKIFRQLITEYGDLSEYAERSDTWLYFEGLGFLGLREYSKAAESFGALKVDDADGDFKSAILLAEASCAVGLEMPGRAIAFLEEYLSTGARGKSSDRARSDLIVAYAQSQQWNKVESAVEDFQRLYFDKTSLLETQLIVAELALNDRRFDLAEQCFRSLTVPSHPRKFVVQGLSGIAWVRMNNGDETSSIEIFEQLVSEFAETPFAAEAALMCGKHFEQRQSFGKAIRMYDHVQNRFGASEFAPLAKIRAAVCLSKSGAISEVAKAESMLLEYLDEEDARYVDEAQYQLAWIFLDTDRRANALELFKEIVSRPSSIYWADSAYRLAKAYVDDNQFEMAREIVADLLKRKSPPMIKSRTHFLAGQLAVSDKNWRRVADEMKAVLIETDDEELRRKARYWFAESLYHEKNYEKAELEFARLIQNNGLITENRKTWACLRRVQCLGQLEKWSAAFDLAVKAKRTFPSFPALYEFDFVIGRAHAAQGRLKEARQSFRQVIQSEHGSNTETAAMAQWRIGETYFHQEEFERAIDSFYRVDSLYGYDKWRAAALVEAGKCQEHLGNWNHAIKLYNQLIEKFPSSEFRLAAEQRINMATRQANRTQNLQKK